MAVKAVGNVKGSMPTVLSPTTAKDIMNSVSFLLYS